MKSFWALTLITVLIHSIIGLQSLLDLQNFVVSISVMIPLMIMAVFDFCLMKFVAEINPKKSKNILAAVWQVFISLLPSLFLRLVGAGLLFAVIMGAIAGFIQFLTGALNIDATQSIYSTSLATLNLK